jgi:hypothetical protein
MVGACTSQWGTPAGTLGPKKGWLWRPSDVASAFPWVVTNGIRAIAQPEMVGACTSQRGTQAGTLGPKKGWLWRPTSLGNENVLICINASFMTQRVLKPWCRWTYQNCAVKRASARAIPGWVTSWEVWFREQKTDNIVSLGVGRYKLCHYFIGADMDINGIYQVFWLQRLNCYFGIPWYH